jgi:hypothetical protein
MTLERNRKTYGRVTLLVIKLFPNRPMIKSSCRTQRTPLLPIRCHDTVNRTVIFAIFYVLVLIICVTMLIIYINTMSLCSSSAATSSYVAVKDTWTFDSNKEMHLCNPSRGKVSQRSFAHVVTASMCSSRKVRYPQLPEDSPGALSIFQ